MDRLAGQFGASTVEREFGTETALDEWTMVVAKLTDDEILAGLERLRESGRTWVPSAPMFAALCRGTAQDQAWDELLAYVCRDEWFTDPLSYAVAKAIGFGEVKGMTHSALRAAFDQVWLAVDRTTLEAVPERRTDPDQLLAPPSPTSREEARLRLREMRARVFWDEQPLALPAPERAA